MNIWQLFPLATTPQKRNNEDNSVMVIWRNLTHENEITTNNYFLHSFKSSLSVKSICAICMRSKYPLYATTTHLWVLLQNLAQLKRITMGDSDHEPLTSESGIRKFFRGILPHWPRSSPQGGATPTHTDPPDVGGYNVKRFLSTNSLVIIIYASSLLEV